MQQGSVSHGPRLRPSPPEAGGRDIEQIWVEGLQVVRAEAFTANPEEARGVIDKVNVFVALTHTGENAVGMRGTDPDVKSFFESIEVRQEGNRAVLNAAMPLSFLRKMLAESEPGLTAPSSPSPAPHANVP